MIDTKTVGMLVAAFVAGSFFASAELRAYAANTIGSADIIDESIMSVDIKDGQVKASDIRRGAVGTNEISNESVRSDDIATDAIGGSELQGVTALFFEECTIVDNTSKGASSAPFSRACNVHGIARSGDSAIATINTVSGDECFVILQAEPEDDDRVDILMKNVCSSAATLGTATISILVWDGD